MGARLLDRALNVDRRAAAKVCIELIKECSEIGEMSETSHGVLAETLKVLQAQEYWQLKNQERHEGKNDPTDKQIAISRVALPALEAAAKALDAEDYNEVLTQLELAVSTEGKPVRRRKRV